MFYCYSIGVNRWPDFDCGWRRVIIDSWMSGSVKGCARDRTAGIALDYSAADET